MAERLEDFIQYKCAEHLRSKGILFFHVPNGAKRLDGARLKAMGLLPGVHDLVLVLPPVVWIELKIKDGKVRPQQTWFHTEVTKRGFHSYLIQTDDWEFAVAELDRILALYNPVLLDVPGKHKTESV